MLQLERGKKMIDRTSWKIIELVIRRYPDSKMRYEQYISDIMASSSTDSISFNVFKKMENAESSKPQSITEAKALKMTSAYADRLKKEIGAVELVYNNLLPEEQKIMSIRYWTDSRRNIPYIEMEKDTKYSERQMRRIIKGIIFQIGKYLGETV